MMMPTAAADGETKRLGAAGHGEGGREQANEDKSCDESSAGISHHFAISGSGPDGVGGRLCRMRGLYHRKSA
jgi:hypothetical protein